MYDFYFRTESSSDLRFYAVKLFFKHGLGSQIILPPNKLNK